MGPRAGLDTEAREKILCPRRGSFKRILHKNLVRCFKNVTSCIMSGISVHFIPYMKDRTVRTVGNPSPKLDESSAQPPNQLL
jgi:hypothetical protein